MQGAGAKCEGDRWRAVWYEADGSRRQCQSISQQGLAARLEKVTERLAADAPNMLRTGSELIGYYLSDDRRPAERAWSRRHALTSYRTRLAGPSPAWRAHAVDSRCRQESFAYTRSRRLTAG
jgi:hypothetical protein